jgi:hypothetical protein
MNHLYCLDVSMCQAALKSRPLSKILHRVYIMQNLDLKGLFQGNNVQREKVLGLYVKTVSIDGTCQSLLFGFHPIFHC